MCFYFTVELQYVLSASCCTAQYSYSTYCQPVAAQQNTVTVRTVRQLLHSTIQLQYVLSASCCTAQYSYSTYCQPVAAQHNTVTVRTVSQLLHSTIQLQLLHSTIQLQFHSTFHCTVELKDKNKFTYFQSNISFYYSTYWRQVSVTRPSADHLYVKFKTGYM